MSSSGKRTSDESEPDSAGNVNWEAVKASRTEVFECKRDVLFPEYLRVVMEQMGKENFAQWLGFGVEKPDDDVAKFKAWVRERGDNTRSADESANPVRVDIAKTAVPIEGIDGVDALVSVPRAKSCANLSGSVDMMLVIDQSGSMESSNHLLKDAIIKLADDAKMLYDEEHHGTHPPHLGGYHNVDTNFAFVKFGSDAMAPGFAEGNTRKIIPGYKPWSKLHEMQSSMRNIAQTIGDTLGSTNMMEAANLALSLLKKRRDDEDLPSSYVQHLLFMTDGIPDCGQRDSIAHPIKKGIGDLSIIVHVLCLGEHTDVDLAEELTHSTMGIMGYANRPETLHDAFNSILSPLRCSAKPLTLRITDKNGTRTEHHGLLTGSNCEVLTKLSFGPKTGEGAHIAATVGLDHEATELAVQPWFLEKDSPRWSEHPNSIPKKLNDALEMQRVIQEHKNKVLAKAKEETLEAALELSSQLTRQYKDTGIGEVALRRVDAFHGDLQAQMQSQAAADEDYGFEADSMASRSTALSAVMSRVSYSQAC